jgi:cellobiose phosphorylase
LASPEVQLLSNGRYHVMLSQAGGGSSRWRDLAVTRWREDPTCDNWGSFLYLRDVDSGAFWSAARQPALRQAETYAATFSEGRAEFLRRDEAIEAHTQIVVAPDDDVELRRLRLTNHSAICRCIELTSYAEVVLATPGADNMHPCFSKLFVQTEIQAARGAILCTRRPRAAEEPAPWMLHALVARDGAIGELSYETDRLRFIGRGRSLAAPQAMRQAGALSGSAGSVLDPVVAIRCRVTLEAGQSACIDWLTGAADHRDACMGLVEKYRERLPADRAFELAGTQAAAALQRIGAGEADARLYRRLAGPLLYADAALRAETGVLLQNRRGQSGLWAYGISGDLPILLLKLADGSSLELARELIRCHSYWRAKGLPADLVIWSDAAQDGLRERIKALIGAAGEAPAIDRPGGIFLRLDGKIAPEDRILLQAAARVVVDDSRGSLQAQLERGSPPEQNTARPTPARLDSGEPLAAAEPLRADLLLPSALGGFSADGTEYHIRTTPERTTPLPWANVLANPGFGSVVTESGLGYSWSENAHEFRLTPWSDDAVGGGGGEALYLRDEDSGAFWSPTPWPCGGAAPCLTRHGFGYSVYEHSAGGIASELWVYVDLEESVKFWVLKLRNASGRPRRLSATGYVEWVLGDLRPRYAMHVAGELDAASGALFARNAYNTDFEGRVAFFDADEGAAVQGRSCSGDRGEFLGRNGTLESPAAMALPRLSGRLGAALDPCGAIRIAFDLADGQERQIVFRLGAGADLEQARGLALRLRQAGTAGAALDKVRQYWSKTLGAVQVQTPDPALDLLANGWLLYQVLACRVWARSGYYQSGGAYGFRDQLQDVMALVHAQPALVREHLLRCAARQFPEGDVQHWWHPPAGRGVRTRCSDDYLWLPLVACRYVTATGDYGVLDEVLPFLDGHALGAEEESNYELPGRSAETASLYQHCVRAILHGLRMGAHGLPLMGSCDWNDGMNLVGIKGKGESVWLGFFLYDVLGAFAELADSRGDTAFAERCRGEAVQVRGNLEQHAWDGAWYRRAWFDDGTVLGSAANADCSIDAIAQSWSVLSGAGGEARTRQAMDSLYRHLVRKARGDAGGLIQLLDPPFDRAPMNPGYIKGYVPGVRENGGQYTHAAVWSVMAFAALGDSRRAWELLALINPVNHGLTAPALEIYKTEPYVIAADVYAIAPHTGRGGWTWYTGSAGWMYRLILESLLGLRREGDRLGFAPCLPEQWQHYSMSYRHGATLYRIEVLQSPAAEGAAAASSLTLDGLAQAGPSIALVDDGGTHQVRLSLTRAR